MNLSRLLLFDASLIIVGIALLLILLRKIDTRQLLGNSDRYKKPEQPSTIPTSLNELLKLEALAKKQGSGIDPDSLIGLWKFVSVWNQGKDSESTTFSSLLRLFSAGLEIIKCKSNGELLSFDIINSIQFGFFIIRFVGSGELKGAQPLLCFYFEHIELKAGHSVLFKRVLEVPEKKNRPFFAFIGIGENGQWLAARGRGGGLALWMKN
tara:strand:+ start:365 stop:991 length:627 start_codon:yes stop_codon:yes gene_type:complete